MPRRKLLLLTAAPARAARASILRHERFSLLASAERLARRVQRLVRRRIKEAQAVREADAALRVQIAFLEHWSRMHGAAPRPPSMEVGASPRCRRHPRGPLLGARRWPRLQCRRSPLRPRRRRGAARPSHRHHSCIRQVAPQATAAGAAARDLRSSGRQRGRAPTQVAGRSLRSQPTPRVLRGKVPLRAAKSHAAISLSASRTYVRQRRKQRRCRHPHNHVDRTLRCCASASTGKDRIGTTCGAKSSWKRRSAIEVPLVRVY